MALMLNVGSHVNSPHTQTQLLYNEPVGFQDRKGGTILRTLDPSVCSY